MPSDIERILNDFTDARGDRGTWESHWESLAKVMHPRRGGFTSQRAPGSRNNEDVLDSTPIQARRSLSTAIDGLLKPKTVKWVFVKPDDDGLDQDEEVQEWTRFVEDAMIKRIYEPKARFSGATGEVDDDLATFGTGVLSIDDGLRNLQFNSHHLKYTFLLTNEDGEISGLFRCRQFKARNAEAFFRKKDVTPGTVAQKALSEEHPNTMVEYVHVVLPREDRILGSLRPDQMPWASLWIEVSEKELIFEGGNQEFPFAIPRWETASGETYGRSPGMVALPDANTLQAQGRTLLKAGQFAVLPPIFAPNQSILGRPRLKSAGITYYDLQGTIGQGLRQPIFPLQTGSQIPIGREMQNDTRELVWSAYFKNILNLPMDGPEMTATEIIERKEQFVRTIGPVFGRLESDYLSPIIERVFSIMFRNGEFGALREGAGPDGQPLMTIPQQLIGKRVHFEFRSPVERIRKQIEAAAALKTIQETAVIAEATQDPSVWDNIDRDKAVRVIDEANASGILVPVNEVEARRQARAEQQQAEQEKADAERAIAAGAEVAKGVESLGNIDIGNVA